MRAHVRTMLAAAGVAVSAMTPMQAKAEPDAMQDCLQARASALRVNACNEAIGSGKFTGAELAAAHRSRASVLADSGKTDLALADLDEAIRLQPDGALAFAARGQLRLTQSNWDRALADYSDAIRLNPKLQSAYIGRGYASFSKGNTDAAIADYSEAIAIDGKSAVAFNNRGLAYRRKEDMSRALADYTTALQINPLYARAYINRGYAYEAVKKPAQAIADFRQALSIDPASKSAREGLARLGASAPKATAQLLKAGAALVQTNCAWCHAVGRSGDSPNVRAPRFRELHSRYLIETLAEPLSKGAVAPHSEMPRFQLSEKEVAAVIAYLNSLASPR